MNKMVLKLIPVVLLGLLLAGCGSMSKHKGGGGAPVTEGSGAAAIGAGAETAGARGAGAWTGNPLDNPNSLLSTRTIYFDFDSSNVRPEYRDVVFAHAEYLAANPQVRLTLEGHTDERGSREYNIALGERRAKAVKEMMVARGASPSQITTISYGEERPAVLGSNESAWARNRRVEFAY
jgi:peptidoglycan-associated lipoprotein